MLFSLISNLEKVELILASTSPRRYEILKSLGLEFRVVASEVDEDAGESPDPVFHVIGNAIKKGQDVARRYPDALVISADTVVSLDEHIMGKPSGEHEAFSMLSLLSGRTHQVYTAYAILFDRYDKITVRHVVTDVTFRSLTEEEIWAYINTGESADKAGAYGIQGQGALLVEGIKGCFFNVVGFPVSSFYLELDTFLGDLAL